jgi:predicted dinucleotide-binding enzyme
VIIEKLAIVGTGLIGGSFALALKQAGAVGEVLGGGAQRHQRDQFALVEVQGQRELAGDRGRHGGAVLVDRLDHDGDRARAVGEQQRGGHGAGAVHPPM